MEKQISTEFFGERVMGNRETNVESHSDFPPHLGRGFYVFTLVYKNDNFLINRVGYLNFFQFYF